MPAVAARYYFSFRSPYSWFATRQLFERYPDVAERVQFVPYWEPSNEVAEDLRRIHGAKVLYAPMSKAKHLYILADTKRMAAHLGYRLSWPVDRSPCWDVPHFAFIRAEAIGQGRRMMQEFMAARWELSENICDAGTVRRLAENCDIPADTFLQAPSDPATRSAGLVALSEAYRQSVFGVPFFTVGRQRFWGVDRLALFVAATRDAGLSGGEHGHLSGSPEQLIHIPVGAFDQDVVGGCG
jgi:2-hydroxychromene-2-carboxylate isomerase